MAEPVPQPLDPAEPTRATLRPRAPSRAVIAVALTIIAAACLSGCGSAGYVAHVTGGQLRILWDRELLDDARVAAMDETQRAALDVIRRAQAYAEEIGLRPSTSYRHVIDRDRTSSVHVVVASPPDRLEPITWWFPVVGRMAYLGYFDQARARAYADELSADGYDTLVRSALLYSTLGYFDDPIPLAVLEWSEVDLTDVIIHELVHGTVFVANDVAYNESLASFIAEQACLRLFAGEPERVAEVRRIYADGRRYIELLADLSHELRALYARAATREQAIAEREAIFRRYQEEEYAARGFETDRYTGFPKLPLSNAFVVAQQTYAGDQPCMAQELSAMGGDLRAFIASHRERPGRRGDAAGCGAAAP